MYDLVVLDDDPIVRVTLAEALRDEGFTVAEATGVAEALTLLDGARVLVTDVPVDEAALQRWPELRVIHVTARAGPPVQGRHRMLVKPFMPGYLVEIVRGLIKKT